jgi:hypothetical protein
MPNQYIILLNAGAEGQTGVLLVGQGARLWVNGRLVAMGMHVLQDRDELRVYGMTTLFFSTERLACVESFPGGEPRTCCPRCKLEIEEGCPVVRCPTCKIFYHQDLANDFSCFTYSERCALCDQVTDLDAGYRWTPEEL